MDATLREIIAAVMEGRKKEGWEYPPESAENIAMLIKMLPGWRGEQTTDEEMKRLGFLAFRIEEKRLIPPWERGNAVLCQAE